MKLLGNIFWNINACFAFAILLSYLAPIVNPSTFWPLSFFGLFYPVLLIINIAFVIYWLITKPTKSWLSLFCIILGWGHMVSFVNFNTQQDVTSKHVINVMTYNIQNADWSYHKDKEKRKQMGAKFIDFLQNQKTIDILCTQEAGYYGRELVSKGYDDMYTHYSEDKGTAIWSKYPIINKGEVDFGTKTNSCMWADIAFPADTVRVYSTHLYSNNISRDANKVLDNVNLNEKKTWTGIGGILNKYKNANQKRSEQSKLVKSHMEDSPFPIILTGDFNDPPTSYTYKTMIKDMSDAFTVKGAGVSSTYAGRIPLLRIDYIMLDSHFEILTYDRLKVPYSDHYPITSSVILKERKK